MIGRFIPTSSKNSKTNIIEWRNGPLTDAIQFGYSGLFLNIDSTDNKILERINCLLDQKETEKDNIFKIPENPNLGSIKIDPNFHFYCTCSYDKLDSLSDAFLNRLTVINIDDQLEGMNKKDYSELIEIIFRQENIEFDKDLIKYLVDEQIKNKFSMSELGKLSKCCLYLSTKFPDLDKEANVNYIKELIIKNHNIDIPLIILNMVEGKLKMYETKRIKGKEDFYFNSPTLKELLAKMYTCMICNINCCLIGKTGIGKTNLATTFSKIFRPDNTTLNEILFSFNNESTMESLYGTFAFEGGKTIIVEGPLYKSINEGLIFIADEFNLAEESIIQSFINVLEVTTQSSKVLIPGINKTIPYNKECFIIICQNDSNTKGRRHLPNSIKKKIRIFEYPEPTFIDINEFSQNIILFELGENYYNENIGLAFPLSNLMENLNKKEIVDIGRWSMRDIRKIFRRINAQRGSSEKEYIKIKDIHQIVIYIFSGIAKDKIEKVFEEIAPLIKESFHLKDEDIKDLELMLKSKAEIKKIEDWTYIMKGEHGKRIIYKLDDIDKNFYSFFDSLFYASFADIKEPLLICGPSGYKTFLAKKISHNSKVINIYPETSLSQLLGSTRIRDNISAKKYYLKEILSICNCKEDYKEYEKLLEDYFKTELTNIKYSSRGNKNIKDEIDKISKNVNEDLGEILKILKIYLGILHLIFRLAY